MSTLSHAAASCARRYAPRLLALALAVSATAQPAYQIVDLGILNVGDSGSQALGVSPGGVAVGRSLGSTGSQAFVWTLSQGTGGLAPVPGRSYNVANDANDAGRLVGTGSTTFFGSSPIAAVWAGGVPAILALPVGQTLSRGNGINLAGSVVGSVGSGSGERAAIWIAGAPSIIVATTPGGASMTTAYKISDAGIAVGNGIDPSNLARNVGLMYDSVAGTLAEVPPLVGQNGTIAFDISNAGHIVGSSSFNQAGGLPFRWDAVNGSIAIPLPAGSSQGSARGVNDDGWVVGTASGAFAVPFLYDGTQTWRLQDLLPAGSGWDLSTNTSSSAMGISDDGIIVGTGVHNGLTRAYAMVPVVLCRPDLTTGAVAGNPGYGVPNGVLNNDDFFYYLAQFAAGNLAVADMTTGAIAGQPGYGVPNGVLNNEDFFYYLAIFAAGC